MERKKSGRISVTRRFEFAYAHHLPGYEGKCSNIHGHNAIVDVTLSRSVEEFLELEDHALGQDERYVSKLYAGMVADFGHIKDLVGRVIGKLDHTLLNELPDFRTDCPDAVHPTAENTALMLSAEIEHWLSGPEFPGNIRVERVRVYETTNSYAEWAR